MTSARAASLVIVFILAAPRTALADDNHYQDYIIGDRAVGLGGAFTAISDDSSGAYYNPAGLAESASSSVSLSAAVYGWASNDWRADSIRFESGNDNFITYPTTAAWIQRVREGEEDGSGRVQLALSLVTPRSNVNRKRLTSLDTGIPQSGMGKPTVMSHMSVLNMVTEDDTLWVGVSVAWKVMRRLSLGLSVFVSYRSAIYQEQGLAVLRFFRLANGNEFTRLGLGEMSTAEMTHIGLLGVLGAVVPITDHFKVGASFRSPGIELYGKADFAYFGTGYDQKKDVFTIEETLAQGVTYHHKEPLKATLGLAYVVPSVWGAALDFSIYGPVGEYAVFEDEAFPRLEESIRLKKKVVWQLDVGGEYYILGRVPLRAGFFTNRSSFDPVERCGPLGNCAEGNFLTDAVHMYGVSGSVGYELNRVALNFGASYSFGSNDTTRTFQTALGNVVSYELSQDRSYLFISIGGSFRF